MMSRKKILIKSVVGNDSYLKKILGGLQSKRKAIRVAKVSWVVGKDLKKETTRSGAVEKI
jgi:hypothetical protein